MANTKYFNPLFASGSSGITALGRQFGEGELYIILVNINYSD